MSGSPGHPPGYPILSAPPPSRRSPVRFGEGKIDRAIVDKTGFTKTSSNPPYPSLNILGRPCIGGDAVPSNETIFSRPGRSVTISRPSGD